jgi:hypothetical protein
MLRITARQHEACVQACVRIREQIADGRRSALGADADLLALNLVAAAFTCNAKVTRRAWRRAAEAATAAKVNGFA